eukprot:GEMP01007568.1.p1 GENE.GEMP01007568.1~~GEMP01007568.1.p1  ORF type:complete len:490 (+),score=126.45 GEMP01007568.1:85-1554(+)
MSQKSDPVTKVRFMLNADANDGSARGEQNASCDTSWSRASTRFSEASIPVLQELFLKEDAEEEQRIWAGKALASTLEYLGPKKCIRERQPLLEALPALLVKLPFRGAVLSILTAVAQSFDALVEHDLGLTLILSGLRFALVEVQMNLESVTLERDKDIFAFSAGCFFAETVITQLDEDTMLPMEAIGNILTALRRIMVIAFDYWVQEEDAMAVPKEFGVPLARLISAWTNGDPEKFKIEFKSIIPKLLMVAPEQMMPAIVAVHERDSGPEWVTKASLHGFFDFLLTDGASFPRQVACRMTAEIAMDPYIELHDMIPPRDKCLYDKRGQAEAAVPRPMPCQVLSCPTCYVINAWATVLEGKHKQHAKDNPELSRAYCVAAYCLKANCGNLQELPEIDFRKLAPTRIKNEAGYLFRAAVRAACVANKAASFTLPKADDEWLHGDADAAQVVLQRTPQVSASFNSIAEESRSITRDMVATPQGVTGESSGKW